MQVGTNLNCLYAEGYHRLSAIEISNSAVKMLRSSHPALKKARIYNEPIELTITRFTSGEFDLVFSMAVLEHLHTDSDFVFPHIARIAGGHVITVEDEKSKTEVHFPRNYRSVFEGLGMSRIEEVWCRDTEGLGPNFYARVFEKADSRV